MPDFPDWNPIVSSIGPVYENTSINVPANTSVSYALFNVSDWPFSLIQIGSDADIDPLTFTIQAIMESGFSMDPWDGGFVRINTIHSTFLMPHLANIMVLSFYNKTTTSVAVDLRAVKLSITDIAGLLYVLSQTFTVGVSLTGNSTNTSFFFNPGRQKWRIYVKSRRIPVAVAVSQILSNGDWTYTTVTPYIPPFCEFTVDWTIGPGWQKLRLSNLSSQSGFVQVIMTPLGL